MKSESSLRSVSRKLRCRSRKIRVELFGILRFTRWFAKILIFLSRKKPRSRSYLGRGTEFENADFLPENVPKWSSLLRSTKTHEPICSLNVDRPKLNVSTLYPSKVATDYRRYNTRFHECRARTQVQVEHPVDC